VFRDVLSEPSKVLFSEWESCCDAIVAQLRGRDARKTEERDALRVNGEGRGVPGTSMNKGFQERRERCFDSYRLQVDLVRVLLRSVKREFFMRESSQKSNAIENTKSEKN
jgi:hypothetical protein